jgi:hypothetical protein
MLPVQSDEALLDALMVSENRSTRRKLLERPSNARERNSILIWSPHSSGCCASLGELGPQHARAGSRFLRHT